MPTGEWRFSLDHGCPGLVLATETLWGATWHRLWLPEGNRVVAVRDERVRPLDDVVAAPSGDWIAYLAAAARVAQALTGEVLLAPLDAAVIPLPHQILALQRAVAGERVRYLLADEVGLGKTIEAGLILRELKLRGLARRALVVAPKSLVVQWVAELKTHFGEDFRLVLPEDVAPDALADEASVWRRHDQIVCSLDAVKPLDRRRGWSADQVAAYNQSRFEGLIAAGWDLVIVDEAHRLGGSTERVARHRLGRGLAAAAPHLLLLSATPHQGKSDAFRRLIALLDPAAFPEGAATGPERVRAIVIRTPKRRAIDAQGRPLFQPRRTRAALVAWQDRHRVQRLLYEAVGDYVREGYNRAIAEKQPAVGFLLSLMQRLVSSSTRAIRTTLERRLAALPEPAGVGPSARRPGEAIGAEEWADLDGQEQVEAVVIGRLAALVNERAEVELLLEAARRAERTGPDVKSEALIDWIVHLEQAERDPALKVLIFTEFVATQAMLAEFLAARGLSVACLHGGLSLAERERVQAAFARDARILISTDAGGEGLNLQFCHVVVNYDLPWNPMRIEQRIGRVDRIGQTRPVVAVNLTLTDTVEHRVREVLEEKLSVILAEFGVDKTGDVLDSAQSGELFDALFLESLRDPAAAEARIAAAVDQVREQARSAQDAATLLAQEDPLDPALSRQALDHPLPHWIERLVTRYARSRGGAAEQRDGAWTISWPGGETESGLVFAPSGTLEGGARRLTLLDARLRALIDDLPAWAPGLPVPHLHLDDLPAEVRGFWSLWAIGLIASAGPDRPPLRRWLPVFQHDNGRTYLPTARRIWDQLLVGGVEPAGYLMGPAACQALEQARAAAETGGETLFADLARLHAERLARERAAIAATFASRRAALGDRRPSRELRGHLADLARAEEARLADLPSAAEVVPDLRPILLLRVDAESGGA